MYNNWYIVI